MKSEGRPEGGSFTTREEWLTALAVQIEPLIKQRAGLRRRPYRIACGWPSRSGTSHKRRRIGECWNTAERSTKEMFISPTLDDPAEVASTVAHELLHAFLPPGVGHRKPFSQAAKKLGMTGAPTECGAGEELAKILKQITDGLGPYPHEAIDVPEPKEKCRNLKYQCPGCGYNGRSSAYWLDNFGPPFCGQCNERMVQGDDIEVDQILEIVTNVTEMKVPGDGRFRILRTLHGKDTEWTVIDYDALDVSTFSNIPTGHLMTGNMLPARHTRADSREHALEIIDGIRSGLTTYAMLAESNDLVETEGLYPKWLGDDEDEEPDYPEDQGHLADLHELPPEVESRRRAALEQVREAA